MCRLGLSLRLVALVPLALTAFATFTAPASAATYLYDHDQLQVFIGGFAEFDAIRDSTRGLTELEGSSPIARKGTAAGENPQLVFSDRNTRFSLGVVKTRSDGLKLKSYLEFDFFGFNPAPGTGTEASFYQNATMRIRHAYLEIGGDDWSFLAGQYWSPFGWQNEYLASSVSVTAITGALFERVPQLAFVKEVGNADRTLLQGKVAVERPVQRESGVPNFDAGLRLQFGGRLAPYTSAFSDVKPTGASIAVSGTARELVYPQASGLTNQSHKTVGAIALSTMIPLIAMHKGDAVGNTLAFNGEFTKGSGYGDQFPNWTGNIANPNGSPAVAGVQNSAQPNVDPGIAGYTKTAANTFTPIHLQTWNGTLQYHLPVDWHSWTTAGFGELWSDNASDLRPVADKIAYTRTQIAYIGAVHDMTSAVRFGLEYGRYRERFADNAHNVNDRVQFASWYRF